MSVSLTHRQTHILMTCTCNCSMHIQYLHVPAQARPTMFCIRLVLVIGPGASHRQGKLTVQNGTLVLLSPRADSDCIHQLVLTSPRLPVGHRRNWIVIVHTWLSHSQRIRNEKKSTHTRRPKVRVRIRVRVITPPQR